MRPSRSASQERLGEQSRAPEIIVFLLGRRREQLADVHVAGILGDRLARAQNEQRHHDGARPVGHLVEVEWKPSRQQHDFDGNVGHSAPRQLREQRERDAREHIGPGGAAMLQNRGASARHVRRIRTVAGELQGIVGLDRAADVEFAAVIERPAAVLGLCGAQMAASFTSSPASISSRKCIIMMYSAGMVQSASSSNSQYPCASWRAISASRASATARSSGESVTRRSVCETMSPRASACGAGCGARLRCDAAHDPEFP